MGVTVEFRFNVGEKVKTPFDEVGIVRSVAIDWNNQKVVNVDTKSKSDWYQETELEIAG